MTNREHAWGESPINLIDACHWYESKPHQIEAWDYLQSSTPTSVLKQFAELYRNGPPTSAMTPRRISEEGLALIAKFEGTRLESYLCPAGVWTIGTGHTGSDVGPGQTISEGQAAALLEMDCRAFEKAITELIEPQLTQKQFDALVSWAFNVGSGAVKESTLRRRLNSGDDVATTIAEELPRWNKGPNGPLEGLTRRRAAEVEHACT